MNATRNNLVNALLRIAPMLIVCISIPTLTPNLSAQSLNEDPLKAKFLILFKDYFYFEKELHEPFAIGFLNENSLMIQTQELLLDLNQSADFSLHTVENEDELTKLDILVVGHDVDSDEIPKNYIDRAIELGILTVGEEIEAHEYGVILTFDIIKNRLRFTINFEAAERAKIKPSSKIAKLAINKK